MARLKGKQKLRGFPEDKNSSFDSRISLKKLYKVIREKANSIIANWNLKFSKILMEKIYF